MSHDENAWVAHEYVKGRSQTDIAKELGISASAICMRVICFCHVYERPVQFTTYGEERVTAAADALRLHLERGGKTIKPSGNQFDPIYSAARHEYAWLLRADGKTLRDIAGRLGVSPERARQMIGKFARRIQRAMRKTRFTLLTGDAT